MGRILWSRHPSRTARKSRRCRNRGAKGREDLGNRADGEREDERQEEVPVRGTPPSKGPQELNGPVERPSRAIDHRRHHLVVPEDATILRGTRSMTSTEWFIPTPP